MKPPPRKRTKTNPSLKHASKAASEPQRVSHWTRPEQQRLLRALRKLPHGEELNYTYLTKSVRSRSCSEVSAAVESLKDKVIALANSELKRRQWDDKHDRKPIQVWTSLASAVAGTTQDSISTAFSQMLIVSSIEPRTLTNCDPGLRPSDNHLGATEPPMPMPCSSVRVAAVPKGKVFLPQQRLLTPVIPTSAAAAAAASSQGHDDAAFQQEDIAAAAAASAAAPSPSAAAPAPCAAAPAPCAAAAAVDGTCGLIGGPHPSSDDPHNTSTEVSSSVDFEKIYRFLGAIQKPSDQSHLTAMEGAVVLDLLMSLPEELPHLNCRKLREHLIQVFQCLTFPADSSDPSELFQSLREVITGQHRAAAVPPSGPQKSQPTAPGDVTDSAGRSTQPGGAESQSAASHQSPSSQSGGSTAAIYPPLNPFLVPLELLRRR